MRRKRTVQNKQTKPNITTITIFNGLHEVRSYSLDTHGEMFIDLANEFLSKHKDYTIATS